MHHKIIEAIKNINVKYYLAGDNNNSYFESLKEIDGFEKVNVIGKVSKDEVKKIYAKSAVGIALNDYVANVGFHEGSLGNTQVFENMEAGLPVIGTDFNLWKKIIVDNHCGLCVNPNSVEEITNAINYLLENKDEAIEMGKNGRKAVEREYNWSNQEKKLYLFYEGIK